MANNKIVRDLQHRRTVRYDLFFKSIKSISEDIKSYRCKYANELIADVIDLIKSVSGKQRINSGEQASSYNRYLTVKAEHRELFIEKVISSIRDAREEVIEKELKATEKTLRLTYFENAITEIPVNERDKYEKALKCFVYLSQVKAVKELEDDLFEIKKDIQACLNYNDKLLSQSYRDDDDGTIDIFVNELTESEGIC